MGYVLIFPSLEDLISHICGQQIYHITKFFTTAKLAGRHIKPTQDQWEKGYMLMMIMMMMVVRL